MTALSSSARMETVRYGGSHIVEALRMLGQLLEKNRPVGATRTFPTPPYPSTHNLGTCRMSENPRDGACNKFDQAHDVRKLCISEGVSGHPAGGIYRCRNVEEEYLTSIPEAR